MQAISLIGCSAAACAELGPEIGGVDGEAYKREYSRLHGKTAAIRRSKPERPIPADRVPAGTCRRCGLVGQHATALDCIGCLRDALADLEMRRPSHATPQPAAPGSSDARSRLP